MTPAHRRYLVTEACVGAAINGVLSVAFVFLMFAGQAHVSIAALTLDALPQSFMIALMASIVPTLITRRRLRAGAVRALPSMRLTLPRQAVPRGLVLALVIAALAVAAHWLLLPLLTPASWPFAAMLAYKAVYGALLGAGVTLGAVRVALGADPGAVTAGMPSGTTHPV